MSNIIDAAIVPHSSDPECCGCLVSKEVDGRVSISCNECGKEVGVMNLPEFEDLFVLMMEMLSRTARPGLIA